MADTETPDDSANHPLTAYLTQQKEARDKLVTEIQRLERQAAEGATAGERSDAVRDGPLLVSKLAQFEDAHNRFLFRVFTLTSGSGPADDVVAETKALNEALANAIVKSNHGALMLRAVTSYLKGAIAVFNGKVDPKPDAGVPT